jgi:hypothetical protein
MDWIIVVLFLTDDRKLHQSIAERMPFKSSIECREHYNINKKDIDNSISNSITNYLPQKMGYNIEWIGCMRWGTNKMEIVT